MNQAVMIINCYLYGATAVMLLVLVLIVYLRGQVNHFPNPFAKKNLVYFSKMIGEKRSLLATDPNQKSQPIIKPADLAHLEQDLFVICDDGAIRLRKNFYFK